MSTQKEIFYNLFWKSQSCRNLFLLSKEELLDAHSFPILNKNIRFAFPRIILSNVTGNNKRRELSTLRTDTHGIQAEQNLAGLFQILEEKIKSLSDSPLGRSFEKLLNDLTESPFELLHPIIEIVFSEDGGDTEKVVIAVLQKYGFIGKHITNFDELINFIEKEVVQKNIDRAFSEDNIHSVLDGLRNLKDVYWTNVKRTMSASKQSLVNALHEKDTFKDRLHLFDLLYDQDIIRFSNADSFIECPNCDPGRYRGMLQIGIRPTRTSKLICPICTGNLHYYIPYNLHPEIYSLVKAQDGLLLNAICQVLDKKKFKYHINHTSKRFPDVEIDCLVKIGTTRLVVESKMYKLETDERKLFGKVKSHVGKLRDDIVKIKQGTNTACQLIPILVVNISNASLLQKIKDELIDDIQVMSIEAFEQYVGQLTN